MIDSATFVREIVRFWFRYAEMQSQIANNSLPASEVPVQVHVRSIAFASKTLNATHK